MKIVQVFFGVVFCFAILEFEAVGAETCAGFLVKEGIYKDSNSNLSGRLTVFRDATDAIESVEFDRYKDLQGNNHRFLCRTSPGDPCICRLFFEGFGSWYVTFYYRGTMNYPVDEMEVSHVNGGGFAWARDYRWDSE